MEELIKKLTKKIGESEKDLISKHFDEEEEDLTGRLLQSIEKDINNIENNGYSIKTKIFRRKNNLQESIFGADCCVILRVNDSMEKYFLSQAKKVDTKSLFKVESKLKEQCLKMQKVTSDAFVFVYTKDGIYVKSALNDLKIFKTFEEFFGDFLSFFIGEIHYWKYRYPHYDNFIRYLSFSPYKLSEEMNVLLIEINDNKKN